MTKRAVTVIPATKNMFTALPTTSIQKRRVAAYARVSTDSDEQFTSYEAQIDYYTQYIKKREDWQFVKVYTDEGISGTNTKHREGFNQMVADALAGKIDLIITKSVSRFARNTVDSLTTVRKLKEKGVEIFFEKENIYTFDSKGELMITIMSSMAQEESRSISENVTWGQRKRFADGKVTMPYKNFLGYKKGEDGQPIIDEEQAKTVRLIYHLFLMGKTPIGISNHLNELGIPSPSGKSKWSPTTILSILTNEKYKGDALLQKRFTVDYLTKKQKVNQGEVPQYYVENSHPAIISALQFDMVQAEIARRKQLGRSYSGSSIFTSKIICGDCGGFYGKKTWHSKGPYKKEIWQCNHKFKNKDKCTSATLDAETIQQAFLQAYNLLMGDRDDVVSACESMRELICDCTTLDVEIESLNTELEVISGMVNQCIKENSTSAIEQDEYTKKYNGFVKKYEKVSSALEKALEERKQRTTRDLDLRIFIVTLKEKPLVLEEWNDELWITLLESATVYHGGKIKFLFKNGAEIEIQA